MGEFVLFFLEESIVNSFAIFGAAALAAYIAGPFLIKVGANPLLRAVTYSALGVAAGVWSYSSYSIPSRPLQLGEAFGLSVAMSLLAFAVIYGVIRLRASRKVRV